MKKLVCLFLGIMSIQTMAFSVSDVTAAQSLADQKIINNHIDNPLAYRLDDTITRAEIVGIALKINGQTPSNDYACRGYFEDVKFASQDANAWICRAVE